MTIRLYGAERDLEQTGHNSGATYYRLTLWVQRDGIQTPLTAEHGYLYATKREIFADLKQRIINELARYGISAR